MKVQRVVEGQDSINTLLEQGWKLETIMPHSQCYEQWFMGGRRDDGVHFWVVGVLSQELPETDTVP